MAADDQDNVAVAAHGAPQSVGQLLRTTRIAQNLSIEQVSAELRIEAPHLYALEENKFERIGVSVFVKGYLRQYGARLGVDPLELLALYEKQPKLEEIAIQPSRTIKLHDERQITVWIVAAIVLLLLAVAFAVWWMNGGGFELPATAGTPPAESSAPATEASAGAAAAVGALRSAPRAAQAEVGAAAAPLPPASAPSAEIVTTPAASAGAALVPGGNASASAGAASGAAGLAAGGSLSFAGADVRVPLELDFTEESWVEITDARGERLYFGLGTPPGRVAVRGEPPFAVVLGNAGAVNMTLDDAPYEIPAGTREGTLVRFTADLTEE